MNALARRGGICSTGRMTNPCGPDPCATQKDEQPGGHGPRDGVLPYGIRGHMQLFSPITEPCPAHRDSIHEPVSCPFQVVVMGWSIRHNPMTQDGAGYPRFLWCRAVCNGPGSVRCVPCAPCACDGHL